MFDFEVTLTFSKIRSSHPEGFLGKGVLKICSKFTGEHPCRSAISIKLRRNFIDIALLHGCSPVTLLHIFRTPFPRNTAGWLLSVSTKSITFNPSIHDERENKYKLNQGHNKSVEF